jgi:hypothetical protein
MSCGTIQLDHEGRSCRPCGSRRFASPKSFEGRCRRRGSTQQRFAVVGHMRVCQNPRQIHDSVAFPLSMPRTIVGQYFKPRLTSLYLPTERSTPSAASFHRHRLVGPDRRPLHVSNEISQSLFGNTVSGDARVNPRIESGADRDDQTRRSSVDLRAEGHCIQFFVRVVTGTFQATRFDDPMATHGERGDFSPFEARV